MATPPLTWPYPMWKLAQDGDGSLDERVADLVSFLEDRRAAVAELGAGCDSIGVYCGFHAGDIEGEWSLTPELMRRAADLDLAVVFALHRQS